MTSPRTSARCLALAGALVFAVPGLATEHIDCSVSTVGSNFGTYSVFASGPLDTVGQVTVSCSTSDTEPVNVAYTIEMDGGSGGSPTGRRMESGLSTLSYQLYRDINRTEIWGDGTSGSQTVADEYSLDVQESRDYPVYGRIPAQQNVPAGSYADTILVTVNF